MSHKESSALDERAVMNNIKGSAAVENLMIYPNSEVPKNIIEQLLVSQAEVYLPKFTAAKHPFHNGSNLDSSDTPTVPFPAV